MLKMGNHSRRVGVAALLTEWFEHQIARSRIASESVGWQPHKSGLTGRLYVQSSVSPLIVSRAGCRGPVERAMAADQNQSIC
jgi:hypothetical protein